MLKSLIAPISEASVLLLLLAFQVLLISNGSSANATITDSNSLCVCCGWIVTQPNSRMRRSFALSSNNRKRNPNNLLFLLSHKNKNKISVFACHGDLFCTNPQQEIQHECGDHSLQRTCEEGHTVRRKAIQSMCLITLASITAKSFGQTAALAATAEIVDLNKNRPYAPTIEPLIPAVLVKLQLDTALRLADEMSNAAVLDSQDLSKVKMELASVFERPASTADPRPLFVGGSAMKLRYYKERQFVENKISSSAFTNASSGGMFMLPLSGKFVRAACNMYTANLRFSESYVLTADPATRRQLIRNDALPDVSTVITADLDLRDLYRNEMQTAIDDVQAELYSTEQTDPVEVQELLRTALAAMNQWLALVRPQDVQQALEITQKQIISSEGAGYQLKLPDPYS